MRCALDHRQPDRISVDFGGTPVSGIHATCVLALRDYFGLEKKPNIQARTPVENIVAMICAVGEFNGR